jgi:hypothetical protein
MARTDQQQPGHGGSLSPKRRGVEAANLLYAWEEGETHIKAFDTAKMRNIAASSVPFVPRYRVELTG